MDHSAHSEHQRAAQIADQSADERQNPSRTADAIVI
jgi:hypothetical protein